MVDIRNKNQLCIDITRYDFHVAFLPPKGVWGFPQQAKSKNEKMQFF